MRERRGLAVALARVALERREVERLVGELRVLAECDGKQYLGSLAPRRRIGRLREYGLTVEVCIGGVEPLGIGGDGIILIKKGTKADFEMVMYNADGSRSQMCGNGVRCVGKLVYDAGYTKGREFTVESMGAVKVLTVVEGERGDKVAKLSVDMGSRVLQAGKIPVNVTAAGGDAEPRVIKYPLLIGGVEYKTTCVSMGNPHAVVFIDKNV